jgi:predicted GH43/DUF377 family glycosyl hydrolase
MQSKFIFLSLSLLCVFGKGVCNPDSTKYLLLDKRIIELTENVKLEVGKVEKHPANPLFGEENGWEIRYDNLYGNVIFDREENIYKCWYSPFIVDYSARGMTLEQREKPYKEHPKREMGICYATSKDGINWEKPGLGLVEYNGSKNNNIVWRGPHGAGILKDLQETDPAKRYKVILQGMAVAFSADGIHWSKKKKVKGVSVAGDTHNNAFWAPTLNTYVGITRTWGRKFGREVARMESDDFINWTKEEVVLHGTDKDLQTYAMPSFFYKGVYLGLLAIYQPSTDRVWTELAWSPDTRNWYRIDAGNPLISNSAKELDYDYGCVYACATPVFTEDKIMLYYGGSDWLHFGWRNGFFCLATLRPDGFAGYVQENKNLKGVILTRELDYKGGPLKLTADVEYGGSVKVSVLHGDGRQIATSQSITKTATDEILQLSHKIKEGKIRLKIELKQAKVYSFSIE